LNEKKPLKRVGRLYRDIDRDVFKKVEPVKENEIMKNIIGSYHLRLLWLDLQKLKPDENGNIIFNFERFKRIHDIAPDATAPE
jgi:hypothetical protein